jgi:hypothetical protein
MKYSLLLIFFIAMSMNLMAQSDYDYISHDEFYILKTGSDLKNSSKIKASDLKSSKVAEQLFGTKYTSKKYAEFLSHDGFTKIVYNDGLELDFPEYKGSTTDFRVTSDKYSMFLANGLAIKVGMKAYELEAIFPKSYSNRKVITDREDWKGKATFNVYFSQIINGKLIIEPACIVFVLSEKNGVLEQFMTWVPD